MKKGKALSALLLCYLIWGLQPLYWDLLENFSPMFVLCTRIVMSMFFTWLYLICSGRLREIFDTLRNWSVMKYLLPASLFLCCDWAIFIWAVASGHLLDATLGYYLNPLVIFLVGVFVFREKGDALEYTAVGLACVGIAISTISYGSFPALALLFTLFWPVYATIKKAVNADPIVSVAIEAALMTPFAIVYALIFCRGDGGLASVTWSLSPLLLCSGVITALPMILYTYVVNDLPFKVVGILQYAGTSINFLCGILFMHETLSSSKLIMFVFIWLGLIIFTLGSFRKQRHQKTESKQ
ncbi:MAG: EamA family transporter RarD [Oscillospiraceae bacterium]